MQLRPYQKEALNTIKRRWLKGDKKQVIVLATGLGKTIIFAQLIHDATKYFNKKALVLVHREELLHQAKEKLLAIDPTLDIGLEMADMTVDTDMNHQVVIASVATIGRADSKRIKKFDPKKFCMIVTDEAHHASASTYKNVYRHFGVLKAQEKGKFKKGDFYTLGSNAESDWNPNILMLGVTATPSRNDNQGIDQVYDVVVYDYGIIPGIENGYLSRIRAFRVDTKTDLTKVKKVAGDFNQGELGDAVNNEERNKLIVKAYLERTLGQQALVFAVDVNHTITLTNEFTKNGISASYVTGDTPKDQRRQILKDFSNKKIKVLINCAVLTEGFDEPSIQAILLARPTQSGILFQQMVGRGTRLAPGKQHLTLIDFVDNTYRQTLQTTASLLGIPGALDFKGEDVLRVKEKVDQLIDLAPNTDLEKLDIRKIDYAIEEVDLLSGLKIPEELADATELDWHRYSDGNYQLSMPEKRTVHISQQVTGEYLVHEKWYDAIDLAKKEKGLATAKDLMAALEFADAYVLSTYPEHKSIVSVKSKWRRMPPSMPQVELLQKLGVKSPAIYEQLDRGQAARLISKLFSFSKRQRVTKFSGQLN